MKENKKDIGFNNIAVSKKESGEDNHDMGFRNNKTRENKLRDSDLKDIVRSIEEYDYIRGVEERKLYLNREILNINEEGMGNIYLSQCGRLIREIMRFNREDANKPVEERQPIMLYINCIGGDMHEGFGLIGAIETSKTPVYTVNIGMCASMAFLISITGDMRFALPNTTFLMHDGWFGTEGSTNKVLDTASFYERFEKEVIKKHVLKHSIMRARDYNKVVKTEFYMLPKEALEWGFVDRIVTDINEIL